MKKQKLFSLLLTSTLVACGGGGGGSASCSFLKIAGGEQCKVENSAVVQIISRKFQGISGCSGTVVAPNIVITAGHCVVGSQEAVVVASNGTAALVEQGFFNRSQAAPSSAAFDLGFYVIPASFTQQADITPLPIFLGSNVAISEGDTVSVYGYGVDEHSQSPGNFPKTATMTISNRVFFGATDTTFEFTAFNNTKDDGGGTTCPGDSGGPALFQSSFTGNVGIVGVVSRGVLTAKCYSSTGGTRFAGVDCDFVDELLKHTDQLSTIGECI